MSNVSYKVMSVDGIRFLTVYQRGSGPLLVSDETHTNLDSVLQALYNGEDPRDLIDRGRVIENRFKDVVVGRVAVRGGKVYFDDDLMHGTVVDAILRFVDEDLDVTPLVKFMENIMANPQEHSREQFYRWIEQHDFPINEDGCIVAYKGVTNDLKSIHSGGAYVDGEWKVGQIPNEVGSTITMGRSEVMHDPSIGCHTGLHAGTWEYASSFGDRVLHVLINPRDVVSVPNDSNSQKVRVCRYEVLEVTETKHSGSYFPTAPVVDEYEDDDDDFIDDDYWDEYLPTV